VGVDDPGNHRAALKIRRSDVGGYCNVVSDRGESSIADQHLRHDPIGSIHRVNSAVDECLVFGEGERLLGLSQAAAKATAQPQRSRGPKELSTG
jgi:hypothetical protein